MPKVHSNINPPLTPREVKAKLKARMQALKPLPHDWKAIFVKAHPEYDTVAWGTVLTGMVNGRAVDETVLSLLEDLFKKSPTKKKS